MKITENTYKVAILVTISLMLVFVVLSTVCCLSFSPVQVKGQPDECNDMYTIMKYNVKSDGKAAALLGLAWNDCKEARKQKKAKDLKVFCKESYFGDDVVDRGDFERYAQYIECIKKED